MGPESGGGLSNNPMVVAIECPQCSMRQMESPESLCRHVELEHHQIAPVAALEFSNRCKFERWLSSIESSRTENHSYLSTTEENGEFSSAGESDGHQE